MPELSVIVTSYNIADYLEQCLDSVLGQTVRDLEVIVVDDGSTDRSPEIVQAYAARDDRVIPVLLETNSPGGVATAANEGLERATAPYVGFADGDDFLEPEMFERLLNAAKGHDSDLAMCKYHLIDTTTGRLTAPAEARRWDELDREAYSLDAETTRMFLRFIAVPWRKIYRRELLEEHKIRFPVGDYFFEDNPFHWFSLVCASSIAVVPDELCYHRVDRSGQTRATADERLFRIFAHHDTIRDWLVEGDLFDLYAETLLAWVVSQVEWIAPQTPVELRPDLFETLQPIIGGYTRAQLESALVSKGANGRRLAIAVHNASLGAFMTGTGDRARRTSPIVNGLYHLRYSGPTETLRIARRYARLKLDGSLGVSRLRNGRRTTARGNADVLFALSVLERRLEAIEQRLDDLSQHTR